MRSEVFALIAAHSLAAKARRRAAGGACAVISAVLAASVAAALGAALYMLARSYLTVGGARASAPDERLFELLSAGLFAATLAVVAGAAAAAPKYFYDKTLCEVVGLCPVGRGRANVAACLALIPRVLALSLFCSLPVLVPLAIAAGKGAGFLFAGAACSLALGLVPLPLAVLLAFPLASAYEARGAARVCIALAAAAGISLFFVIYSRAFGYLTDAASSSPAAFFTVERVAVISEATARLYPASIAARALLGNGKAAGTLVALALLSLAAALAFANVLPRLPFKTPALKEPRFPLGAGARSALFRHEIILSLRKGGTGALLPFVLVPLVSLSLAFLCDRTAAGLLPVPVGGLSATAASLVSVATLGGGTAIARGKEFYIHAATLPVKAGTVARAALAAAAVRSGLCSALSAAALAAAGLASFSVAVSCFASSFAVSAASGMLACRAELMALARSGSGDGAGEGVYALSTLVFCALTVGGGVASAFLAVMGMSAPKPFVVSTIIALIVFLISLPVAFVGLDKAARRAVWGAVSGGERARECGGGAVSTRKVFSNARAGR